MITETFKHTIVATGSGLQRRFTTFAGTQAIATDVVLGVAMVDYVAGQAFAADVAGIVAVEAGSAVPLSSWVIPDALGRAVANDGTATNRVGRALNAVTAAGQTLFILFK
jgi:Uncharacterized conserved protein (DUF2190)